MSYYKLLSQERKTFVDKIYTEILDVANANSERESRKDYFFH